MEEQRPPDEESPNAMGSRSNAWPVWVRWGFLLVLALSGVAFSVIAHWRLSAREGRLLNAHLKGEAERGARAVERRLRDDVTKVYGLARFAAESEAGTRAEFLAIADPILEDSPDLMAALWVAHVTPGARAMHEEAASLENDTEYRIRERASDGSLVAAEVREDSVYYPVYLAASREPVSELLGLDLASDPVCREAIIEARDTGRLIATGRSEVGVDKHAQRGIFVFRPIYRDGNVDDTPALRREKLLGFAVCVIHAPSMLEAALENFASGIDVRLFDEFKSRRRGFVCAFDSETRKAREVFREASPRSLSGAQPFTIQLDVPGYKWSLECVATAAFFEGLGSPLPVVTLLFGIVITALVTIYASTLLGQTVEVEKLVVQRTNELRSANEHLKREVAERVRAEVALKESELRFRSLVETTSDWIWEVDANGVYTYASPRVKELLGYGPEEVVGKTPPDLMPPEKVERATQVMGEIVASREPFVRREVTNLHRDGSPVVIESSGVPIRGPHGNLLGYRGIDRDVTDRKRAEEDLAYERFLLATLMEYSPDYIYFKDTEGRFLRVSKVLADHFGLEDPSEACEKTDFDFFSQRRARQALADEQEVMRSRKPMVNKEERQTWPDGRLTWVTTSKVCLRNPAGKVMGTFGISRDVTERKQAEVDLKAAKEAAESANEAKSAFLANMSHEIRTPMNAILGMTELVLDTRLSAHQRDFLCVVQESGDALLSVINDILDFSKIEAGKVTLDRSVFDLAEVVGDTMRSFAVRADRKALELAYHVAPDVPPFLRGDRNRLRQVIVNLVGNAIKFTEAGEVIVKVSRESESDDTATLRFSVTDTGIGVAKEKLAVIFGVFEQADNTATRRYGGTGLGLAISSKLAELMGGRIWAESQLGQGSTFHFTAPFEKARADEVAPIRSAPEILHDTRVLVVDDNTSNLRILEEMLRNWSMNPECTGSAQEAIEVLREARQAGEGYHLVVTDAYMPETDGFTLAEQIREDPELGSTVIMMLTSGTCPADVARCEEIGLAAYLLKPVKQSELLEAITLALFGDTPEGQGESESSFSQLARGPALQVLLAEDSLVNQKLAVALLQKHGHSVTVAGTGEEAVGALRSGNFHLVLMDVQMPEMDGLEATMVVREEEAGTGRHVPIVAMTAHAMKGDRERCLEAGMDGYVSKPIRPKVLFDTIEEVLTTVGMPDLPPATGEPSAVGQEPEVLAQPQATVQTDIAPETEVVSGSDGDGDFDIDTALETGSDKEITIEVDWKEALNSVRGDTDLLAVIVEAALEECPKQMAGIRKALADGDAAGLRLAAHTLKGAVRYFERGPVFEHAYQLERMGQEANFDGADEVLAVLDGYVEQILVLLANHLRENQP